MLCTDYVPLFVTSSLSRVRLFVTSWTVADHAPPSKGFSRQEYWSGLPFPSPGDLSQADAIPSKPPGNPLSLFRGKITNFYLIHHVVLKLPENLECWSLLINLREMQLIIPMKI